MLRDELYFNKNRMKSRDVIVITTAIMGDFKITLNAFIVL